MASVTLTINNQAIETRFFPDQHLKLEGYLQGLKLDMLEQNDDILRMVPEKPEFQVEVILTKNIIQNWRLPLSIEKGFTSLGLLPPRYHHADI